MLLISKELEKLLRFLVSVIPRLGCCVTMVVAGFSLRISAQTKVCGYNILWHQCKNFHCDTASKPEDDKYRVFRQALSPVFFNKNCYTTLDFLQMPVYYNSDFFYRGGNLWKVCMKLF